MLSLVASVALSLVAQTKPAAAPPMPPPTQADVAYGPHAHQRIDVYLPPQGDGPFPVLIWFGGIWQPGRRPAQLQKMNDAGVACVAVQTRTMTDATSDKVAVPVSYVLDDAARVVQFVRSKAKEWNLNPDRIALGGGSQGALPALYVGCSADRAAPESKDPVERESSRVTCVAAYRCQPTIDPKRMQEWVPGVKWGAPALGCTFEESLARRDELLPILKQWSPDHLLHKGAAPMYFENEWGMTQPEGFTETNYKVHSPAWAVGFQKLAHAAGATCYVKYPGHPTDDYADIWDFVIKKLTAK